ncbi:MAG: acetyltransferase [Desulfobulbus propionicus]|nr:MAG: acetyltransferase [Desulfobulbus propionicus]
MSNLAVLGASGHGKVAAEIAELLGWEKIIFFDDAWPAKKRNAKWSVDGTSEHLSSRIHKFSGVFVAIGDNTIRHKKLLAIRKLGAPIVSLLHPQAVISSYAKIGKGTLVVAGAIISPFAQLGEGCIVNTGAGVDHDCHLGDAVHISPGAHLAGGVMVGDRTLVGMGAQVIQGVTVGEDSIIGAGAVVIKTVADNAVVAGVPALPLVTKGEG